MNATCSFNTLPVDIFVRERTRLGKCQGWDGWWWGPPGVPTTATCYLWKRRFQKHFMLSFLFLNVYVMFRWSYTDQKVTQTFINHCFYDIFDPFLSKIYGMGGWVDKFGTFSQIKPFFRPPHPYDVSHIYKCQVYVGSLRAPLLATAGLGIAHLPIISDFYQVWTKGYLFQETKLQIHFFSFKAAVPSCHSRMLFNRPEVPVFSLGNIWRLCLTDR